MLDATTVSGASAALDPGEQSALDLEVLRPVLLDQGGALDGRGRIVVEADPRGIGARGQPQALERRPGRFDEFPHPRLGVRRRIVDRDREPAGEELRRPAGADRAGAEHRDAFDLGGFRAWHGGSDA